MRKLYLDCDGVILDTINTSYEMIRQRNLQTEPEVRDFYRKLDWGKLIIDSGEIDNSIEKIKELLNYFDIEILTHINSENEIEEKRKYFASKLPDVNVIYVPKIKHKCDVVDPKNNILVDDFLPNLEKWEAKGGIPIKFSDSGKKCEFTTITDLLDLLEVNFDYKPKVKNK